MSQRDAETTLWYFSYGANMSAAVLTRRGVSPRESIAAHLGDHSLRFSHQGLLFTEPAFANIEPEPGGVVHGVLHRLSEADLGALDRIEGAEYRHVEVEVHTDTIGPIQARAYRDPYPVRGRPPSRRYLQGCVAAGRAAGLPEGYLRVLEGQPSRHVPVLSELTTLLVGIAERMRRAGLRPEVWRMKRLGQVPRESR